MGQVTARTRALVEARDQGCAARGIVPGVCGGHLDAGHIVGRGMGGTPQGDRFDGPEWIVLHCRNHNRAIESQPDVRSAAEVGGHRVSVGVAKRVPEGVGALVHYADGWFRLTPAGGREPLPTTPVWQEESANRAWLQEHAPGFGFRSDV